MHLKKLLYITCSILIIITLIIPAFSYAIDEDSIYVWSSDNSSVSTSVAPEKNSEKQNNEEESNKQEGEESKESSRKFFRNYIRKRNFDGSKDR